MLDNPHPGVGTGHNWGLFPLWEALNLPFKPEKGGNFVRKGPEPGFGKGEPWSSRFHTAVGVKPQREATERAPWGGVQNFFYGGSGPLKRPA